jgi:hypothetical protein
VRVPTKLSTEERGALEAYAAAAGESVSDVGGILGRLTKKQK